MWISGPAGGRAHCCGPCVNTARALFPFVWTAAPTGVRFTPYSQGVRFSFGITAFTLFVYKAFTLFVYKKLYIQFYIHIRDAYST